jgi:hypothetical protein
MKNAEQNGVLRWTGMLLSADDLRRHLKGQRELIVQPRAIVTPLVVDELKKLGVRLVRAAACGLAFSDSNAKPQAAAGNLGYAQERSHPLVTSAVRSLEREGVILEPMQACEGSSCDWARNLAECVARGDCLAGVVFCVDPGLVCCVANKIAGLRAVSVLTAAQAARSMTSLGANLLAVEMPGRTFFEVRQIMLSLGRTRTGCPAKVADILQELDGHSHR